MIRRIFKILTVLFILCCTAVFSQGGSLSPHDLKTSYLERKAFYKGEGTKQVSISNQADLDRILQVLKENAPNSYEYYYVKYLNGNYTPSVEKELLKAYQLKPDEPEVLKAIFGHYALTFNDGKRKEIGALIKHQFSKNELDYYQRLIDSQKAEVIIFSGQKDAYPALLLQTLGKVREGVLLVNLDFLQNNLYRKKIQSKLGMKDTPFLGNEKKFVTEMLLSTSKTVAMSTTVNRAYLGSSASDFFLGGLVYEAAIQEQYIRLSHFWENSKMYLLELGVRSDYERNLFSNYLPPLLTLYKLKLSANEKDLKLRKAILQLAEKVEKNILVTTIINGYEQNE